MRTFALMIALGVLSACGGQFQMPDYSAGSLDFGVSTMGVTVEPSLKFNNNTGARVLIAHGSMDGEQTIDGITYNADLTVGGVGVLGDYYPGGGNLRLSGGLLRQNINLDGRAAGTAEVGNNTYTGVDLVTNVTPANSVLPMASIGVAHQLTDRFSLSADLGAIYVGNYSVSATDNTNTISSADIQNEVQAMEDELNSSPIVPYIRLGGVLRW